MADTEDAARYRLLYDLGCAFTERIELDELLPFIIEKCREALSAEGVAVLLHDKTRKEFYFPYVSETDSEVARRLSGHRFPADMGFAGLVLASGRSLKVDDVVGDRRHYHGTDQTTGLITRNLIASPLNSRQGPIGVVEVVNRHGTEPFSDADLHFLEALAGSIAIALDNARLYAAARLTEASLRTQVGVLRRDLARHDRFDEMIGTGPAMSDVFRLMETAAASSITVLIEGETGTGKELVARGIHRASARAEAPLLAINCAAMPESLLESELFGHRRGAFTGAVRDSPGLFRAANGGTVFLDEIGEMPAAMQAKLLRVVEQSEVIPLGESVPTKVDVRIISASNRDLRSEVRLGRFRDDLFYRIAVFPIRLPPLRERREDIPLLLSRFAEQAAARQHKHIAGFEQAALAALAAYDWPGNIRELQNEVQRGVALSADNGVLTLPHFSDLIQQSVEAVHCRESVQAVPGALRLSPDSGLTAIGTRGVTQPVNSGAQPDFAVTDTSTGSSPITERVRFREARAAFEARFIEEILGRCDRNVSRAAKEMGMSRVQLQRKIKEYRLR